MHSTLTTRSRLFDTAQAESERNVSAMPSAPAAADHLCQLIQNKKLLPVPSRLLVAGCGDGSEALHLYHNLQIPIVAFDIKEHPSWRAKPAGVQFLRADVGCLPFPDESFDAVFYHHVIEHVPDPEASLRELSRVLCNGGWMYIGTPNRHRLVGYLGSPNVTWKQKLAWNLADYKARLRGRFRNELGAHAGFTQQELQLMLEPSFTKVQWLTTDYLRFKYGGRLPAPALELLVSRWGIQFLAPAIYALCWKGETPPTAGQ
jgi:ubiquinone/menaquinone biosynthesis C-methylase UbiE